MTADQDRLFRTATEEARNHTSEAARLTEAAKHMLEAAEFHTRQAERWQQYAGELTAPIPT